MTRLCPPPSLLHHRKIQQNAELERAVAGSGFAISPADRIALQTALLRMAKE